MRFYLFELPNKADTFGVAAEENIETSSPSQLLAWVNRKATGCTVYRTIFFSVHYLSNDTYNATQP